METEKVALQREDRDEVIVIPLRADGTRFDCVGVSVPTEHDRTNEWWTRVADDQPLFKLYAMGSRSKPPCQDYHQVAD